MSSTDVSNATSQPIRLLALDIGGVLAEIDKTPLLSLLHAHGVDERAFFDDDFTLLQSGLISSAQFFFQKQRRHALPPRELAHAWQRMLKLKYTSTLLCALRVPYIFASNINRFHFNCFIKEMNPSNFALTSSILSFRINCLKPADQFYQALGALVVQSKHSILYIDDVHGHVAKAQQLGLTSQQCSSPCQLEKILDSYGLI